MVRREVAEAGRRGGDEERIEKESTESSNWDSLRISTEEDSSSEDMTIVEDMTIAHPVCIRRACVVRFAWLY